MTREAQRLIPAIRFSKYGPDTWGPYWDAIFGWDEDTERLVAPVTQWKLSSTAVNVARSYWDAREYRRLAYESVYGSDPEQWPVQHPGIVLGDCAACLRCHHFVPHCGSLRALDLARLHETSGT